MKFMLFVLPTVPGTLEDRKRLRPIGRNNERYQQMLDELRKLAVLADEAGFDVFATTEHHFHSEGYEASVAPLLLYADLAARTKRIKFSPLGWCCRPGTRIRAAEELAVLDHLTKGRVYAGFARGYQDRWVNVLGQQYHVTGGAHGRLLHRQPQPQGPRGGGQGHQEGLDRGACRLRRRVLQGAVPVRGGHPALAGGRLDPPVRGAGRDRRRRA